MGAKEPERQVRGYRGLADLAPLLAFASRLQIERRPFAFGWHPGDFVWNMQGVVDQPMDNRMAFRGEAVEAFAGLDGGMLWIEAAPEAEDLLVDLVRWAEAVWAEASEGMDAPALSIRACDEDARRIAAFEALGYRRMQPEGVRFRLDLTTPLAEPPAIAGFRTRDSVGVDPAARASAHRDAWDHLGHIGLPQARSAFSTERYLALAAAPLYDPSLDILVEGPDGDLVGGCVCWADEASGVGVFEPVGVSPKVRGRRVAGLAIHEGLRRLAARGMREAHVGTAYFNTAAIGAYLASGFTLIGRSSLWSKAPV